MIKNWLRWFANWLLAVIGDKPKQPTKTEEVVKQVFGELGLPVEQFSPDFNLLRTGKIYQLYHISAQRLGVEAEFDTVADVIKWLDS